MTPMLSASDVGLVTAQTVGIKYSHLLKLILRSYFDFLFFYHTLTYTTLQMLFIKVSQGPKIVLEISYCSQFFKAVPH